MIRFGLCCIFKDQPIKFRRTTARYLSQFSRNEQLKKLSDLCLLNSDSLMSALTFCRDHHIGSFRINSQILPLKTHPAAGYSISDLPESERIVSRFKACGRFARSHHIRTTFHPDQFIILNSPRPDVVQRSISDLDYQARVSGWVNADVINIHAGGVYGNKQEALSRLKLAVNNLPESIRTRLTLENDDRSYTPKDLLPVCLESGIPLVYDVHHHRCLPDGLSLEEVTESALKTWNREPLFHLSSPINGFNRPDSRQHHDYIDINDFPEPWHHLDITVEIEAKAKELAVLRLIHQLQYKKAEPQRGSA